MTERVSMSKTGCECRFQRASDFFAHGRIIVIGQRSQAGQADPRSTVTPGHHIAFLIRSQIWPVLCLRRECTALIGECIQRGLAETLFSADVSQSKEAERNSTRSVRETSQRFRHASL